jgi:hypothetical protein
MDIIIAGLNITPGHIKDRHISFIYIWSDVITFCRFVPQSYHILCSEETSQLIIQRHIYLEIIFWGKIIKTAK